MEREKRQRWTEQLLSEANRSGLGTLSVAATQGSGKPGKRRNSRGDAIYNLRAQLPSEVVFDVDAEDWSWCQRVTHLIWSVLERWDVPFYGALTGGKGTHTHVFIRPHPVAKWDEGWGAYGLDRWPKVRKRFADAVLIGVMSLLPIEYQAVAGDTTEEIASFLTVDPVCLNPAPEARLLRAFGAEHPDTGWRKTLWTRDRVRFLPGVRDEAYMSDDVTVPHTLVAAERPPGASDHETAKALGKTCIRSWLCLPHVGWGDCGRCPLTM